MLGPEPSALPLGDIPLYAVLVPVLNLCVVLEPGPEPISRIFLWEEILRARLGAVAPLALRFATRQISPYRLATSH